jgi:hypothetical protein
MSRVPLSRRAFHAATLAGLAGCRAGARGQNPPRDDPMYGSGASLRGLEIFPPDNPWNQNVSKAPLDRLSDAYLRRVGLDKPLHPDFGTVYQGNPNGIPYVVVPADQPRVQVTFRYGGESDPGPYPVPPDAPIEGGPNSVGDRHVLMVDRERGKLYELFSARPVAGGKSWEAGSGAIFDLRSNAERPAGWTSADAAGLPVLPGLVRYEDVVRNAVHRAFRFTVEKTQRAYAAPARHFASSSTDIDLPPMGMRARLKANYDTRKFPPQARVILEALKVYGMLLADNGGDWFLSGAPDPRWDDEDLHALKRVKVRDFEIIKTGVLVTR